MPSASSAPRRYGRRANLILSLAAFILIARSANPQERDAAVTLHAVGDILLTRGIGRKITAHGEQYPFAAIMPTLKRADMVIGNLECALSDRPFTARQQFRFRASPDRAKLLSQAGISYVNLANNHAADCGPAGLRDTVRALDDAGVRLCGLQSQAEADPVQFHGLRIALVGFSDFPPAERAEGETDLCYASEGAISDAIKSARKKADVVVVSIHWGLEQHARPSGRQRRLARIAAQAGADLVLGHHPHVLQGFEVVPSGVSGRRTLVAYSLGSFLFDGHKNAEKQSLVLRCVLGKTGLRSAEIIPVQIEHSAPRPATQSEAATTIGHIRVLSGELGTRMTGPQVHVLASAG